MKSKIKSVQRLNGETSFELVFEGKAQGTGTLDSKNATMPATLTVKNVIADELKVGTIFTVVVDDDPDLVSG